MATKNNETQKVTLHDAIVAALPPVVHYPLLKNSNTNINSIQSLQDFADKDIQAFAENGYSSFMIESDGQITIVKNEKAYTGNAGILVLMVLKGGAIPKNPELLLSNGQVTDKAAGSGAKGHPKPYVSALEIEQENANRAKLNAELDSSRAELIKRREQEISAFFDVLKIPADVDNAWLVEAYFELVKHPLKPILSGKFAGYLQASEPIECSYLELEQEIEGLLYIYSLKA